MKNKKETNKLSITEQKKDKDKNYNFRNNFNNWFESRPLIKRKISWNNLPFGNKFREEKDWNWENIRQVATVCLPLSPAASISSVSERIPYARSRRSSRSTSISSIYSLQEIELLKGEVAELEVKNAELNEIKTANEKLREVIDEHLINQVISIKRLENKIKNINLLVNSFKECLKREENEINDTSDFNSEAKLNWENFLAKARKMRRLEKIKEGLSSVEKEIITKFEEDWQNTRDKFELDKCPWKYEDANIFLDNDNDESINDINSLSGEDKNFEEKFEEMLKKSTELFEQIEQLKSDTSTSFEDVRSSLLHENKIPQEIEADGNFRELIEDLNLQLSSLKNFCDNFQGNSAEEEVIFIDDIINNICCLQEIILDVSFERDAFEEELRRLRDEQKKEADKKKLLEQKITELAELIKQTREIKEKLEKKMNGNRDGFPKVTENSIMMASNKRRRVESPENELIETEFIYKKNIFRLESDLLEKKAKIEELEKKVNYLEVESDENKKEIRRLSQEESSLKKELSEVEVRLYSESEGWENELSKKKQEINDLRKENGHKESEIKELKNVVNFLNQKLSEKEGNIVKLVAENRRLKEEKKEQDQEFDVSLDSIKKRHQEEKKVLESNLEQLRKDKIILESQLQNRETLAENLINELSNAEEFILKLKDDINQIKQDAEQVGRDKKESKQNNRSTTVSLCRTLSSKRSSRDDFPLDLGNIDKGGESLAKYFGNNDIFESPPTSPTSGSKLGGIIIHSRSSSIKSFASLKSNLSTDSLTINNSLEDLKNIITKNRKELSAWEEIGNYLGLKEYLKNSESLKEILEGRTLADLLKEIDDLRVGLKENREKELNPSSSLLPSPFGTPFSSNQSSPRKKNSSAQEKNLPIFEGKDGEALRKEFSTKFAEAQKENQRELLNDRNCSPDLTMLTPRLIENSVEEERIIRKIVNDLKLSVEENISLDKLIEVIRGLIRSPSPDAKKGSEANKEFVNSSQNSQNDDYEKIKKENEDLKRQLILSKNKLLNENRKTNTWKKRKDEIQKKLGQEITEQKEQIQSLNYEINNFHKLWEESKNEITRMKEEQKLANQVEILVS